MTREEAILCLKGMKNYARDTFTEQTDWQDSLDMAIDALESKTNGMTNGDMIKAMFPNANESNYVESYMDFNDYIEVYLGDYLMRVSVNWWNAPYQSGVEQ